MSDGTLILPACSAEGSGAEASNEDDCMETVATALSAFPKKTARYTTFAEMKLRRSLQCDPFWSRRVQQLNSALYSFEEAWDECGYESLLSITADDWLKTRRNWLHLVHRRSKRHPFALQGGFDRTDGYAAIAFIPASLAPGILAQLDQLLFHEQQLVNIIYFTATGKVLDNHCTHKSSDIKTGWYQEACFRYNYLVYERVNDQPHLPGEQFTPWSRLQSKQH